MIKVKNPEKLTEAQKRFLSNVSDAGDSDVSVNQTWWTKIRNWL